MFRPLVFLIALSMVLIAGVASFTPVAAQEKNPTAEQVVESTIFVYGTRPVLDQIRRKGVERGRITKRNSDGRTEESRYERHFIRGESFEKDKIRIDQKMASMEYSLIYGEGRLWGIIDGAAFTPRQEAASNFLSQNRHSIDTLLRYKENGCTIELVGRDKQKGLDLFVVALTDKDKQKTTYYISSRTLHVLWLEYDGLSESGENVKYTLKFSDYRWAQSTRVPYRTILFEDGEQTQETRIMNITYGVKIEDSLFSAPDA